MISALQRAFEEKALPPATTAKAKGAEAPFFNCYDFNSYVP
ncbi:hypothetical protein [Acidovorax sp. SUPP3334]|nr:hypothetical protein [Acidovorax sp. SUPP3334]GKT23522.1 hypothetical protein AVHM3334_11900 [Acidovorax sp. SUPP3334]